MLIRFSVENYRSFKERQVFSMAAGKHTRHKEQLVVVNGKRLLKAGVVYGANASGKSNLIKAVNFGKKILLRGVKNGINIPMGLQFPIQKMYSVQNGCTCVMIIKKCAYLTGQKGGRFLLN